MRETPTLELSGPGSFATTPVRRLLGIVLLLAAKDRATQVRFDPVPPGQSVRLDDPPWDKDAEPVGDADIPPLDPGHLCRLRYEVEGTWHDMVPAPFSPAAVAREVLALSGMGPARRLLRHVLRSLRRACGIRPRPVEGRLSVRIGGVAVEVLATVHPDDSVVLRLADTTPASDGAREALAGYLAARGPAPG